jgi:hypothetical protein
LKNVKCGRAAERSVSGSSAFPEGGDFAEWNLRGGYEIAGIIWFDWFFCDLCASNE